MNMIVLLVLCAAAAMGAKHEIPSGDPLSGNSHGNDRRELVLGWLSDRANEAGNTIKKEVLDPVVNTGRDAGETLGVAARDAGETLGVAGNTALRTVETHANRVVTDFENLGEGIRNTVEDVKEAFENFDWGAVQEWLEDQKCEGKNPVEMEAGVKGDCIVMDLDDPCYVYVEGSIEESIGKSVSVEKEKNIENDHVSGGLTFTAEAGATATFATSAEVGFEISHNPKMKVKIQPPTLTFEAEATISVDAAIETTIDEIRIPLMNRPQAIRTIATLIGPIPVVVVINAEPILLLNIAGSSSSAGSFTYKAGGSFDFGEKELSIELDLKTFKATENFKQALNLPTLREFDEGWEFEFEGESSLEITAQLGLEVTFSLWKTIEINVFPHVLATANAVATIEGSGSGNFQGGSYEIAGEATLEACVGPDFTGNIDWTYEIDDINAGTSRRGIRRSGGRRQLGGVSSRHRLLQLSGMRTVGLSLQQIIKQSKADLKDMMGGNCQLVNTAVDAICDTIIDFLDDLGMPTIEAPVLSDFLETPSLELPKWCEDLGPYVLDVSGDFVNPMFAETAASANVPAAAATALTSANSECVVIVTSDRDNAEGYLKVIVNGETIVPDSRHARGSTVLSKCFSSVDEIEVENPETNGWIGDIMLLKGGAVPVPLECEGCQGLPFRTNLLVDGDGGDTNSQVYAPTYCVDGDRCTFTKKAEPSNTCSDDTVTSLQLKTKKSTKTVVTGCCNSDFNHGAGGDDIFLHAMRYGGHSHAISDLRLTNSDCPTSYKKLDTCCGEGNLNNNAGGSDIYLCYKEFDGSRDYVTDLQLSRSKNCGSLGSNWQRVGGTSKYGELNIGVTGSPDIWLCMKKETCHPGIEALGFDCAAVGYEPAFVGSPNGECLQNGGHEETGTHTNGFQTLDACAAACDADSSCNVFDFNKENGRCFLQSYCDSQNTEDGYMACKKPDTLIGTECDNEGFELTFTGSPWGECDQNEDNGGERNGVGPVTVKQCAAMCRASSTCKVFDYSRNKRCWLNSYCDSQDTDGHLSCKIKDSEVMGIETTGQCPTGYELAFPGSPDGECDGAETAMGTMTYQECAAACTADSTCKVFDFRDSTCWLNTNCDRQDKGDGCLACKKEGEFLALECPTGYEFTFSGSPNGECLQNGGHQETDAGTKTYEECAEACTAESSCVAFDWKDSRCWLNTFCDSQDTDDGHLSCKKEGVFTGAECPSGYELTFPGSPDGECDQDSGSGETSVGTKTYQECADACSAESTCVAFDWRDDSCWLNTHCDSQDTDDGCLSCKKIGVFTGAECPDGWELTYSGSPRGECGAANNENEDGLRNFGGVTIQECADACFETVSSAWYGSYRGALCKAFDYHENGNCYLNSYCESQDDDNYLSCRLSQWTSIDKAAAIHLG